MLSRLTAQWAREYLPKLRAVHLKLQAYLGGRSNEREVEFALRELGGVLGQIAELYVLAQAQLMRCTTNYANVYRRARLEAVSVLGAAIVVTAEEKGKLNENYIKALLQLLVEVGSDVETLA